MQPDISTVAMQWLHQQLMGIEELRGQDAIGVFSNIFYGLDERIQGAIERLDHRRNSLLVILATIGGYIEVVERCVETIRHFYDEVSFLVPDRAMSAGTVFVMSGDSIWMDHYSRLGPIDPQVENKNGEWVPANAYLSQFEAMVEKSRTEPLSHAELALLSKLDLAALQNYRAQAALSVQLVREWLAKYKFKDWNVTQTRGIKVTLEMKRDRAQQIGDLLNSHDKWLSHSRGISMKTLREEMGLRIDDYSADRELHKMVRDYYSFVSHTMEKESLGSLVHSKDFL